MAVRERSDPKQFYDFSFRELVADPVGAIGRMYGHFGFAFSGDAERAMRAWQDGNPQHKHGGHPYTLAEFGLSEQAIAERFARYSDRHAVPREPRE
jgi:hypothetical protein